MLPSTPQLFSDSIEANIVYPQSSEEIDLNRLLFAIQEASLEELLKLLPNGRFTKIGELGGKLSTGERQRIGLARLFYHLPPLMLLDEPTSALDLQADYSVMGALYRLRKSNTIIVIAHRLDSVIEADQIVVMDSGRVIDVAQHHTLILRCPLYMRLWQSQRREI
jgi:ATP-binding cassette subfamily B protein